VKAEALEAPKEVFTAPIAPDFAAVPEVAKVEEEAGDCANVLREADQAVPEEFPKFGTHAGNKITVNKATVDEEAVRLVRQAARVPDDTKTARPKAAAEAPGTAPVEVNSIEVIPKVEEKGGQARSQGVRAATQEAKPEAEESELLTVGDARTTVEEEPDGNEVKLTGTITSLEGRVKDSVSGLVVTVTTKTVDAEVRVTVVAPLSDTFFITEWPRLAILGWFGDDFSSCVIAIKDNYG
jgi:hypothetical protein